MPTEYAEVLAAANRLRGDRNSTLLAESPYKDLVTDSITWAELRARDESLLKDWALERLFCDCPTEVEEKRQQVRCFVCDVELGYLKDTYPAVIAEVTGNFGSTVYDPIQSDSADADDTTYSLYLHICDMCFCEKAQYLTGSDTAKSCMNSNVSLPYESVVNFPPALKARYQKHMEWVERNV